MPLHIHRMTHRQPLARHAVGGSKEVAQSPMMARRELANKDPEAPDTHRGKAKRVINLFTQGVPGYINLWAPKPLDTR